MLIYNNIKYKYTKIKNKFPEKSNILKNPSNFFFKFKQKFENHSKHEYGFLESKIWDFSIRFI